MDDLKTNVAALLRLIWDYEKTGDVQEHNAELLQSIGAQIGTDCFGNPARGGRHAPTISPVEIFTDGACIPNPGRGGWGFVAVRDGRSIKECFGGERGTTNNRMEITAIIEGLVSIPTGTMATIVSDSQHAINVISGTWRAKANRALVKEAQALMGERHITFRWVRGHAGDHWNERADALAARGMAKGTRKQG